NDQERYAAHRDSHQWDAGERPVSGRRHPAVLPLNSMDPVVQKNSARIILLVFAAICVVWLARLDYRKKISTNVLDLIPVAEQAPEIALIRGFANDVQARVMLFAVDDPHTPDTAPVAAARLLADELRKNPAFAEAVVIGDDASRAA